ncbi:MAG: hypothetical protein HY617_00035 [Candidatus Sungbacteria bacterium]|nr:hypothetical protein [Candidatus Sungbacteria bacterium]
MFVVEIDPREILADTLASEVIRLFSTAKRKLIDELEQIRRCSTGEIGKLPSRYRLKVGFISLASTQASAVLGTWKMQWGLDSRCTQGDIKAYCKVTTDRCLRKWLDRTVSTGPGKLICNQQVITMIALDLIKDFCLPRELEYVRQEYLKRNPDYKLQFALILISRLLHT